MYRLSRVKHGFLFNWPHFDGANELRPVACAKSIQSLPNLSQPYPNSTNPSEVIQPPQFQSHKTQVVIDTGTFKISPDNSHFSNLGSDFAYVSQACKSNYNHQGYWEVVALSLPSEHKKYTKSYLVFI